MTMSKTIILDHPWTSFFLAFPILLHYDINLCTAVSTCLLFTMTMSKTIILDHPWTSFSLAFPILLHYDINAQLVYLSTLYNDNAQNNNFRPPLNIFFLTLYHDTLWKACLLSLHFTMTISRHHSSLNHPWTLIILDLESWHCTNLQDWNTWTFKLLLNFYTLFRVLIVSQAPHINMTNWTLKDHTWEAI
jgi:hypothetical protein